MLNYQDLLVCARDLLRCCAEARTKLSARYRHLLVDEFQDTDPLQAEILFLLAGEGTGPWCGLKLRPGALFLVGDPKQSIYRFRRADMATVQQVREALLASGGRCLQLSTSFRSAPAVCEWVNGAFGEVLPAEADGRQAGFAPLHPHRGAGHALEGAFLLETQATDARRCAREAPSVADAILALHQRHGYAWGDFLVLTMRKADLSFYAEALHQRHIPFEATGRAIRTDGLVSVLLDLLRCLDDPGDAIGVVGVLRGLLFGVDDPSLYRHVAGGGSFELFGEEGDVGVLAACATLRTYLTWWRTLAPGAALERIADVSGLLALAGERGEADELVQATLRVGELCAAGTPVPDLSLELLASVEPLSLRAGFGESVPLMNLHQAKGLEARVVFLASPCGGYGMRVKHRVARKGDAVRGWLSVTDRYHRILARPADWEEHESAETEMLAAEHERLRYVAATRACETVIVGSFAGEASFQPWRLLERHTRARLPALTPLHEPELPGGRATHFIKIHYIREHARKASLEASYRRGHVSSTVEGTAVSKDGPGGTAFGSLVHKLLEHLLRRPELTRPQLQRLARWAHLDGDPGQISAALEAVERLRGAEFWARCMAARERLVEVPVGLRRGDTLLFGTLDLVLDEPGGYAVVDWKTDRVGQEELEFRYGEQLSAYAESWEALIGQVASQHLVTVRPVE